MKNARLEALKPHFFFLCTVFLPDLILWSLSFAGKGVIALAIGFPFLICLTAGVLIGGISGIRWRTLVIYTALMLVLPPLPYFQLFTNDPLYFGPIFWILNGQQAAGFALGMWVRMIKDR